MAEDAYLTAEARARVQIDRKPEACGWVVQDRSALNLAELAASLPVEDSSDPRP